MRILRPEIVLFSIFILAAGAYGQQQGLSFNFFGAGARAEGMANAFLAVSNDGTAGSWNPAGLFIQEKTLMVASYNAFMPRGKYTFHDLYYLHLPNTTYNHSGTYGALGSFNLVSPIRIKNHHFVTSISYTRNFDVYYRFGEKLYQNLTDSLIRKPNAVLEKQGGLNSLNIGIGTRVYDRLSFGVTGNIYYGKVVSDEVRLLEYVFYDNSEGTYANLDGDVSVIDSTKFTGFNTAIGFLYDNDRWRAGLVIRTPFNLRGESDSTYISIAKLNGLTFVGSTESPFFTDTIYVDNMTSKIEIPLMVGFGFACYPTENWLLSTDVEFKRFSGRKVYNLTGKVVTAGGEIIEQFTDDLNVPNWSNVWQFRLGTEYMFDTKYGRIALRAGGRNEAFPEGNIDGYTILSNDADKVFYIFNYDKHKTAGYSLALGAGIQWSRILLDIGYTFSAYTQKIYLGIPCPVCGENILRSQNDWRNHHLNVTFTGYF
jgi:long-subunit fatty acid transport protein